MDELDDLKDLLRKNPPSPASGEAKNAAIFNALAEFDKNNAETSQGSRSENRHMDVFENIFRRFAMNMTMNRAYVFAGSICLAVLAVSLLSTTNMPFNAAREKVAPETRQSIASGVVQQNNMPAPQALVEPEMKENEADVLAKAPMPESAPAVRAEKKERADVVATFAQPYAGSGAVDSMMPMVVDEEIQPQYYQDEGRDKFEEIKANPVKVASEEPVSTFSIDVDTSSYSFVRKSLTNNVLPQKDAVRVEELINYFPYEYEAPANKEEPFKANVTVLPCPWNADTKLMHIGIKGYRIVQNEKPHSNLVFLLDTSGSMNAPDKLPLVISSMKLLLDSMKPDDTISIVTYAGSAGTALEPTKVQDKVKILNALDNLRSGGSTAGAEGIRQAYQLAEQSFDKNGINRVILATDGDFNVGITNQDELRSFIERKRDNGVFLSVLGFGRGNYNDALMQTLAQNGNGNAAYIDTLNEARKVLVEEAGSTLFPIAKDVKIQVEFNPSKVAEYRLIGYETRMLKREDFNNDKVDAGDIGAGHAVTAIYEITPAGSKAKLVDDLRYKTEEAKNTPVVKNGEYGFIKIRYKLPNSDTSKLITFPVSEKNEFAKLEEAPNESRFAASVAAFGQLIRGDAYTKNFSYDNVISLAEGSKGTDKFGYRSEFVNMVRMAKTAPALPVQGQ